LPSQIYGKPDASWLRAQPAYEQTAEHKSKQVAFLTQLGLITGATPTVSGSDVDQMLTAQDRLKLPAAKAATATAPPTSPPAARTGPAPELVSEHGQGGGYR
jgi:hypothetical protein